MSEGEERQPGSAQGGVNPDPAGGPADDREPARERGRTVHGELANAGHRVLAPDDAEVEAYLEVALDAPAPTRPAVDIPGGGVPRGESSASEPDTVV
ncbi:MAG: hypothetical protein ABIG85_01220, partial [Chloroflexota bacterium]